MHVYARGNDRADIFRDVLDRQRYLRLLGRTTKHCRWQTLSYCLMGNHIHLLIETTSPNLHSGMRRMHSSYAQLFNIRHDRTGHLFQGRYGSTRVESNEQLITAVRYIAFNPVAAGLVPTPSAWAWSSHRAIVGDDPAPPWLATERLAELLAGWTGHPRAYDELTRT